METGLPTDDFVGQDGTGSIGDLGCSARPFFAIRFPWMVVVTFFCSSKILFQGTMPFTSLSVYVEIKLHVHPLGLQRNPQKLFRVAASGVKNLRT